MEITKKQKITLLSIGLIVLMTYLLMLTISAIGKLNESKTIQSKNLNIGGIFGLNLGDSIESLKRNKEFSEINEHPDLYKYNYIAAKLKNNEYQRIYFYALPDSNKIYKIIYDTNDSKCDNLTGAFNRLRSIYGVGDYSFFDAFFNVKEINKDNKSIKVVCSSKNTDMAVMFSSYVSEKIIYLDKSLEIKVEDEYIKLKNKKLDNQLQLN